jgi:lysophospholipase L1-like esterase
LLLLNASSCSHTDRVYVKAGVPFMGDSITYFWSYPKINLGIEGNTTSEMLPRFPKEVLGHHYAAVVILGGTNDVRVADSPLDEETNAAIANIAEMARLAETEQLTVVLCTIPPINNSGARVKTLNAAIASYAAEHGYLLADYYAVMAGHPAYFEDALHPNALGYAVMQTTLVKVLPPSE